MSDVWQPSDKPIQATDRESTISPFPRHFATPASDIQSSASSIATSGAGIGIPEAETHPCDYHHHEDSPPAVASNQNYDPLRQQVDDGPTEVYGSSPYFKYRKLVDSISQKLLKENALRLAYLYDLPNWYHEVGPTHDPTSALRILAALEGKGVFTPNNLAGLTEALETVEREDLAKLVREFRKLINQ